MPTTKIVKFKLTGIEAKGVLQGTEYKLRYRADISLDPCVYCGGVSDSWEHIIPASEDGPNSWQNQARACGECNRKRSSRPLLSWLLDSLQNL